MPKSKRGKSPATRKAVEAANLRRKVDRIAAELGTIAKSESDRLLAQSPKALQILFLLQEIAAEEGEFAERAIELAAELQTLLVEQAHQEAIADGAIELPGGSWVV